MVELAVGGLTWLAIKAGESVPGVVSGVFGNVSDRMICDLLRGFSDRIAGISTLPENHDLAKALRTAQIQAIERLVGDYERTHSRRVLAQSDAFISRLKEFCKRAIGRCLDWDVKPPTPKMTEDLQRAVSAILSQPIGESPDKRATEIGKLAEDAVLAELRTVIGPLELPDDFVSHFRNGAGTNDRFLDLFNVYVVEQLKHNLPFRAIFEAGQLSRIESASLEGKALVERLEQVFSGQLRALEHSVGHLEQRLGTTEVSIRSQGLSLEALRAGVDRLLAGSQTGAADIQSVLVRLGDINLVIDQLPDRLASVMDQHMRFREAQTRRSRAANGDRTAGSAAESSRPPRPDERFETLDDVASWITKDHDSRWSSKWLDSLIALRAQGQIDDHDFSYAFSHVAGAPLPDEQSWVELERELHSHGALSRSLMQVPTSSLHASLRLARGAGRLVQVLTALRLGIRISVTVRGIEFVMVPPGSLVTAGASEPVVNHTAYFISRSPVSQRAWNELRGVIADSGATGSPQTGVSITDVQEVISALNSPLSPGMTELPSPAELRFAFDADDCAGLALLHPLASLWHLCSSGGATQRFEVVRPARLSPTCRLDWPSDAARHRDVGFRLVFRPRLERI